MVAFRHSSYRLEIRKSSTTFCHYYWLGWELPCWDGSCPTRTQKCQDFLGDFWDSGIPLNKEFQLFLRRSQGIEYPEGCVNKSSSSKFLNGKEWEKPWKKSLLTLEQRGFLCQGPCDFSEWTMMMPPEKKTTIGIHRYLWNEAALNPSRIPTKKKYVEMLLLQVRFQWLGLGSPGYMFHPGNARYLFLLKRSWLIPRSKRDIGLTENPPTLFRQEKSLELPPVSEEWALDAWKCWMEWRNDVQNWFGGGFRGLANPVPIWPVKVQKTWPMKEC